MKIRKVIGCISILGLLLPACNNFKGYTIDGRITKGLNPSIKKAYLEQLTATNPTVIDTADISTDGSFKMKGFVKGEGLYRLRFTADKFIYLVMQNVPVKVDINLDSLEDYSVSGSRPSSELKGFLDTIVGREKKILELRGEFILQKGTDSSSVKQNNETLQEILSIEASIQLYANNFIDTVKDPVLPIFVISNYTVSGSLEKFEKLANRLLKQYPDNLFVKDYADFLHQKEEQIETNNASIFKIGDKVPDISLTNPDGKIISLSSLRGKYVLLDFWASWCPDCRQENPGIVKVYNAYKDKGFTIYSVSLDDNKDHWINAISYDKLSWPAQVSELKRWDSKVVSQFHLTEIPHNFLLDPQGKVVAINLHGEELENALASLIQ